MAGKSRRRAPHRAAGDGRETTAASPGRGERGGAAARSAPAARGAASHLLVRTGELVCALPLVAVRRVVKALSIHPLPGAAPELKGLAEFGGEPLPVLDLGRMVSAPPGANPPFPVTVIVWTGSQEVERELVGLAADEAMDLVDIPPGSIVLGDGGLVLGEAPVAGGAVRVLDLAALGKTA